jgi:branched-chain amino acid transport system permease protein
MSGGVYVVIGLAATIALTAFLVVRDSRARLAGNYAHDLRQFRGNGRKIAMLLAGLLWISLPVGWSWIGVGGTHLPNSWIPGMPFTEKWLFVMCQAGVFAIAAIGLNLLLGNTGQISLGHTAFLYIGTFTLAYFGADFTRIGGKPLPSIVALILAMIVGALIAAAIGPFALRLRGNYLAIVSLVLVFAAEHIVKNWDTLTGGEGNPRAIPPLTFAVWPGQSVQLRSADDGSTVVLDRLFFPDKFGYFWVIWLCVGISAVVARNLLRSRNGRAMMSVRDRDLSAEVIGVRQMYTKTWAFAVAGAIGALAGALYGSFLGTVNPSSFGVSLSIQFVAMIIVGGVGTVSGSIMGAVMYAVSFEIIRYHKGFFANFPLVQTDQAKKGLTVENMPTILFGLFTILFLIYFPTGLAGVWAKCRAYFRTWPLGK